MKIIKVLAEQITDEVEGAVEYAKMALEQKGVDNELSKLYYELAKTEYTHVQKLHEASIRKINEAKTSGANPPQYMLDKWDETHTQLIDRMAKVKTFMDMYN